MCGTVVQCYCVLKFTIAFTVLARDALIDGEFNKVPLLTGVCSEEGIMMVSHLIREPERWNLLYKDDWWKHLLEIAFHIHQEDATLEDKAILVDIMKAYDIFPSTSPTTDLITGNSPKASKKVLLGKLVDLFSDAYFKVGTLDTAQIVAEGEVPVYQYRSVILIRLIRSVSKLVFG